MNFSYLSETPLRKLARQVFSESLLPQDAEPSKTVVIHYSVFSGSGYFCAEAAPRADKRSAAAPPMALGGSSPWGGHQWSTGHPPELLAQDPRPWGSRHQTLPHQRAAPPPGSGSPHIPTPPGFRFIPTSALRHVNRSNFNSAKPSQILLQPSWI